MKTLRIAILAALLSLPTAQAQITISPSSGQTAAQVQALIDDGKYIINVKDAPYNAVGDNVTDDTSAIQAAINFAITTNATTNGAEVLFPSGIYKISSTITILNTNGISFTGVGAGSIFNWAGNSTTPMFDLVDVARSTFTKFQIIATIATPLAEAFRIENGASGTIYPSQNVFRNLIVQGTDGGIGYCFRGYVGAGGDSGVDFMHFDNVFVANYAIAGWSIEGGQMNSWSMVNCMAAGDGYGKYAVSGGVSVGAASNITWNGGFVNGHTVADFRLGTLPGFGLNTTLADIGSENSNRFLITDAGGTQVTSVEISGLRWSSSGGLNADGYVMQLNTLGPFTVINSSFGDDYTKATKIDWAYSAGYTEPSFSMYSSLIAGTLSTATTIFTTNGPTTLSETTAQTAISTTYALNRIFAGDTPLIHLINTGASGKTLEIAAGTISSSLGTPGVPQIVIYSDTPANALIIAGLRLTIGLSGGIQAASATDLLLKSDASGTVGNTVALQGFNGSGWQSVITLPNKASGNIDLFLVPNGGSATIGASGAPIKSVRHGITDAMTAGVVTVTDTGCTANTRYFFTVHTIGTVEIPSTYYATTRTASTSFVVTASVLTDTSTLDWMAIEP